MGSIYGVACLFVNVHSIFHGNQTAMYFETMDLLEEVTVERYLHVDMFPPTCEIDPPV